MNWNPETMKQTTVPWSMRPAADRSAPAPAGVGPTAAGTVSVASPGPTHSGDSAGSTVDMGLSSWIGIVLSASVIAALITGTINTQLARRKAKDDERARVRNTFAEAFQAYADYKEMPYAIRRRDPKEPAAERRRLSEDLRAVQSKLSYFEMWTMLESSTVGGAYRELIGELRKTAGGAMRSAWESAGLSDDSGMNIPATVVDLSNLTSYERAFQEAVTAHLERLAPRWESKIHR